MVNLLILLIDGNLGPRNYSDMSALYLLGIIQYFLGDRKQQCICKHIITPVISPDILLYFQSLEFFLKLQIYCCIGWHRHWLKLLIQLIWLWLYSLQANEDKFLISADLLSGKPILFLWVDGLVSLVYCFVYLTHLRCQGRRSSPRRLHTRQEWYKIGNRH